MAQRAEQSWITVTELADTLTRDYGVPFKTSHAIASRFALEAGKKPKEEWPRTLTQIAAEATNATIEYSAERLAEILSPSHFVEVRKTPGGPNPAVVAEAIRSSRERLAGDREWFTTRMDGLKRAEEELKRAVAAL
jgi:argininosuccinate lyase